MLQVKQYCRELRVRVGTPAEVPKKINSMSYHVSKNIPASIRHTSKRRALDWMARSASLWIIGFPALCLIQLRCAVFVVEQNCPYQDIDVMIWRGIIAIFSVGKMMNWWVCEDSEKWWWSWAGRYWSGDVSEALRGEKVGQQLMNKTLEHVRVTGLINLFTSGRRRICKLLPEFWLYPCDGGLWRRWYPHIGMAREVIQA